ncbi:16S rRNA (guanine(966)-N(2))-methyltransferase RsmD [Salibacterium aidingense]|uniref:16S rRNA (guanine(966)-N(2))-methyltransferase RsmD n=1 Tax=Salibacterium aidingense TaxID=384933 RepID=UPI0004033D00|nr:16S rRNA (guanine(966)-N(2))-methyltransferase RsmD [Salibacterium aidingense]
MRVISGKYKSRPLKPVQGMKTRPTADKVKEALFHRIGPYFEGGAVLDLYAGTGNLGIEALSRGAEHAVFVDKNPQAVKVIKQNLKSVGIQEDTEVYCNEAGRALNALDKRNKKFTFIFLDPPYAVNVLPSLLESISDKGLVPQTGTIVCEHHASIRLPEQIGELNRLTMENYGDTNVSLYIKE